MQQNNSVILHGEAMVFASSIPSDATPIQVDGPYLVIADSETTGNHHVIDAVPGVSFLEHQGRRFMRASVPTKVRCLHKQRHDDVVISPGDYEFGTQQEYDPFTANMRAVRD